MYRIEVNQDNIGVELETPFSLNPTRSGVSYNPAVWNLLSHIVDVSLNNNYSLFSICNAAISQNLEIADHIPGIWEVLFERARPASIPLRRTECTFFFETKEDAIKFKKSYQGMATGVLCEVEVIKEVVSLTCDMNWLDSINENIATAAEVIDAFKKYWNGDKTDNPVMEVLFVGKYKLKPVK